jgi:hypothetical protein
MDAGAAATVQGPIVMHPVTGIERVAVAFYSVGLAPFSGDNRIGID